MNFSAVVYLHFQKKGAALLTLLVHCLLRLLLVNYVSTDGDRAFPVAFALQSSSTRHIGIHFY